MFLFVITIIDNEARLMSSRAVLKKLSGVSEDFNAVIFPAVVLSKDSEINSKYDKAYRKKHFGFDMPKGEIGCFLSHLEIWKRISDSGDDMACIIEDDAVLNHDFFCGLKAAIAMSEEWDICRLHKSFKTQWRFSLKKIGQYHIGYDVIPPRGTSAYLIKRNAAKRLLEKAPVIREPVDHYLDNVRIHGLTVLSLEPEIVSVRDEIPSVIGRRGWDANVSGRRPLWRRIQRDVINAKEQTGCILKAISLLYRAIVLKSQ